MKTHDALGRRDRYKRIPYRAETDNAFAPNAGDIAMIEAIHRHGPLSSIYLPEFRKPHAHSRQNAVRRLNILFNETNTVDDGAYLSRPIQQTRTEYAHSKHLVYDLTPASERLLKRLGKWSGNAPSSRNPWTHSFMVSSITASIDLLCRQEGYAFIPGHDILDKANATLRQDVPYLWLDTKRTSYLTPDALFAVDYGGKFRAFVVEADRGTEPITTTSPARKSILRNILQYRTFIGKEQYKEAYGLTTHMKVLNVFTSMARMKTVIEVADKNVDLLFQTLDDFGVVFKPPQVLSNLFTEGWKRAGHEPFYINRA